MPQSQDQVYKYGLIHGWDLKYKTVIVEGVTDSDLFNLAAKLYLKKTGKDLLDGLAVVPAGVRDKGGISGVYRELTRLQGFARMVYSASGVPLYRFIGLLDNDREARKQILARKFDSHTMEYKDIFRLHPEMPCKGNLDPDTLKKTFNKLNGQYNGLDWELEDLLPEGMFIVFEEQYPSTIRSVYSKGDKTHRELTDAGKALFISFVKQHALLDDLFQVVQVLKALRFYLLLD